jgi:ketosteroid isomerase-like protein
MAPRDLEIIRDGYQAFLRGDADEAFRIFAPDMEAYDDPKVVGGRVYRGPEGFARMLAVTTEGFDEVEYAADDFTATTDGVLVAAHRSGRGTRSGAWVEERQYHLWELRDGRAVRFRLFLSETEARRAAGLDAH